MLNRGFEVVHRGDILQSLVDGTPPTRRRELVLCVGEYMIIRAVFLSLNKGDVLDHRGRALDDTAQDGKVLTRSV
jgi:hypothetical protein